MSFTVEEIRRRWKPHKLELKELDDQHPTNIRIHRACSWLGRVEKAEHHVDEDFALIGLWVALNSMYGQWDAQAHQPQPEWESLCHFIDHILKLDDDGVIEQVLLDHRALVLQIMEDAYLTRYFWEDPSQVRAGKARVGRHKAASWYVDQAWPMLMPRLLERIYLLRCQLVHGAATHGSQNNRSALRQCTQMLRLLVPAFLFVVVKHGVDEDWGQLCYPPVTL